MSAASSMLAAAPHSLYQRVPPQVHIWELRKGAISSSLRGHTDTITGMSLSPDGHFLLTNAMDNTLRCWDVRPYAPADRCGTAAVARTEVSKHAPRGALLLVAVKAARLVNCKIAFAAAAPKAAAKYCTPDFGLTQPTQVRQGVHRPPAHL